ncbi:hypothetical protein QFC24_006115 [Naganishia onofrii]|uniref:Uncharacterized protein n=1 Tax=Naganishia onofrii TaxID=1851511 RepID=A0ACC2X5A0_9TREE|nr:hypothetical protein QFC24_006115 [Naganishia onofrii]
MKLATLTAALICLGNVQSVLGAAVPYQKRANGTCCAYVVTNRNNGYFRYKHEIDFSTLTSMDKVYQAGWEISDGWQAGGTNFETGQVPWANEDNVELIRGEGLRLKVPKQNAKATKLSVAEVMFPDAFLGGVFEITAKMTTIPGTCMGMFTSHADGGFDKPLGWQDEQDIEMLGASMLQATSLQPAGIQMINYDPQNGAKAYSSQAFPAGIDPSKAFHTYSIAWYPTSSDSNEPRRTEMRLDGNIINSPQYFPSVNPSVLIFNHWTNADWRWSAGPPAQDAYMTIKKLTAYYDKPAKMATGTGVLKQGSCSREQACRVTV